MLDKTRIVSVSPPVKPFKNETRLQIALVGLPNSGKTTIFKAVSSTAIKSGELAGTDLAYGECRVQIGLDEADLIDLPSILTLHHLQHNDLISLQYLLWGNQRPAVSAHEASPPPAPFASPDVIIQVIDATALERHLELSLELCQLGKPMVIALNMMDQASKKGLHINTKKLGKLLGIPVVSTTALMGQGITELFNTAIQCVRTRACPLPQQLSSHINETLHSAAL